MKTDARYMLVFTQPSPSTADSGETQTREFIFDTTEELFDYLKNSMVFEIDKTNQIEITAHHNPANKEE